MVWEIILAVFGIIGLAACVRFIAGLLLFPVKGTMILIPARGDGRTLEHTVKGIRALSAAGMLSGESVYIADCGLDRDGLAAAERLCLRYPEIEYCTLEDIDTV